MPCCPGYYCSRTTVCLQPCQSGAVCVIGIPPSCAPSYTVYASDDVPASCGGAAQDTACPGKYYCPNTTVLPIQCPSGHFCQTASTSPTKCSSFFKENTLDACYPGTEFNQIRGMIILYTFFPVAFFLGLVLLCVCVIDSKEPTISSIHTPAAFHTDANKMEIHHLELEDVRVWRKLTLSFMLNFEKEIVRIDNGFTAIVGLSGVGKSTLFDTLAGNITDYHAVTAYVQYHENEGGRTIEVKYSKFFRKFGHRIAYVLQQEIMHTPLTVYETILYSALMRTNFTYRQCCELTSFWIQKIGLLKKHSTLTSKLSGGMRKRVNVAMELVTDPLILILDEPTSGLDTKTTEELLDILKDYGNGFTIDLDGNRISHTKRIVVAVLHQPSYEAAKKFSKILGVKGKDSNIKGKMTMGILDLPIKTLEQPPVEMAPSNEAVQMDDKKYYLEKMSFLDMHRRTNIMDSYVLSLTVQEETDNVRVADNQNRRLMGGVSAWRWLPRYSTTGSYHGTFFWHFYVSFRRSSTLLWHNWRDFCVWIYLAVALGGALGVFNRPLVVNNVPPASFLLVLATSLICLQTGIQTRLANKPAARREGARGVHTIAIYFGESLVELLWIFASPALILMYFVAYATPRGPFLMYYITLLSVSFSASSLGHVLVEFTDTPGTIGIYLNLALALLCGFSPAKSELSGLTALSFMSFAFEALVNGEYYYYPEAIQLPAQFVLHSTLKISSCTFYNTITRSTADAPIVVNSCPLDCDQDCILILFVYAVTWGIAFRIIVVLCQLVQPIGIWQRLEQYCCCSAPIAPLPGRNVAEVNDNGPEVMAINMSVLHINKV